MREYSPQEQIDFMRAALEQIESPPIFNGGCPYTYQEIGKMLHDKMDIAKFTLDKLYPTKGHDL